MHRRSERGMTIMEVLVATMLLGIIAVIVFSAFAIGLRAASLAGGMNTATGLAEEALATLVASPCGSSFQTAIPPELPDERLARYRREVSARRLPGGSLWELTATVSWSQERQQRSVTLTTYRHVSAACEFLGQP
ncbi:MAG: type II secretion system protein [Armatimonadetes bacterium]|nr:type II secretion system protein [Armatimonadota bacterium]